VVEERETGRGLSAFYAGNSRSDRNVRPTLVRNASSPAGYSVFVAESRKIVGCVLARTQFREKTPRVHAHTYGSFPQQKLLGLGH
jgi:hypothetical protein